MYSIIRIKTSYILILEQNKLTLKMCNGLMATTIDNIIIMSFVTQFKCINTLTEIFSLGPILLFF